MPLNPGHSAFDALPTVPDHYTSLGPGSIPVMAEDAVDPKQVNRTVAAVQSMVRSKIPKLSEIELGVIREAAEEGKGAQEIAKEVIAHYGEDAAPTEPVTVTTKGIEAGTPQRPGVKIPPPPPDLETNPKYRAKDATQFKPGDKVRSVYGELGTVVRHEENNVVVQPAWHTGSPENWHVTKTFKV